MEVLDRLTRRGFEVCKQSGASFNPFLGSGKEWPEQPAEIDWNEWQMYSDELVAAFHQQADFDDNDLGPLALTVGRAGQPTAVDSIRGRRADLSGRW